VDTPSGKRAIIKRTKIRSKDVQGMNKQTLKKISKLTKRQQNKFFRKIKKDRENGDNPEINKKYVTRYGKGRKSVRIAKGGAKLSVKGVKSGFTLATTIASEERAEIISEKLKNRAKQKALKPVYKIKQFGKKGSKAVAKKIGKLLLKLALKIGAMVLSIFISLITMLGLPIVAVTMVIVFILLDSSIASVKPPPLYTQYDERWANMSYGNGTISTDGSMICTLSMLLSYIEDDSQLTPDQLLDWCGDDYYIDGSTNLDILNAAVLKYNLQMIEFDRLDDNYDLFIKRNINKIINETNLDNEIEMISAVTMIGITNNNSIFGNKSLPILITSYSNDGFEDDEFYYRVCSPMDQTVSNSAISLNAQISTTGRTSIPSLYISIYQRAEKQYNVPWCLLAAVHKIETNFSLNVAISSAGAVGHMQFLPRTWIGWSYPGSTISLEDLRNPAIIARYGGYGTDADGDGFADPWDIEDAIFTAAKYLAANGAASGNYRDALFAYNHADWYVDQVMNYAESYITKTTNDTNTANIYYNKYTKGQLIAACSKFYVFVEGSDMAPTGTLKWPLSGYTAISSDYGNRISPITGEEEFHNGIDIPAPENSYIGAAEQGTVIEARFDSSMGNYIKIDHGGGLTTVYMHCSRLLVEVGDIVRQGEAIGLVGKTGDATGFHLHFSVMFNGTFADPKLYLGN